MASEARKTSLAVRCAKSNVVGTIVVSVFSSNECEAVKVSRLTSSMASSQASRVLMDICAILARNVVEGTVVLFSLFCVFHSFPVVSQSGEMGGEGTETKCLFVLLALSRFEVVVKGEGVVEIGVVEICVFDVVVVGVGEGEREERGKREIVSSSAGLT